MKKWVPVVLGWLIFASGILNITSALWSHSRLRMHYLRQFVPLEISYASRTTTILAGMFLLYLANGLWKRKNRAWWMSLGLLGISFISHIFKGLDFEESLTLLIPATLLLLFRKEFYVESGRVETLSGIKNALLILVGLFAYSTLGFYALQGQFRNTVNWANIVRDYEYSILGVGQDVLVPVSRQGKWFEDSISVVGFWGVLAAFGALFAPILTLNFPSDEERKRAWELLKNSDSGPLGYYSLLGDKQLFWSKEQDCYIAYKQYQGTVLALGSPVGQPEKRLACAQEFWRAMKSQGLSVAVYGILEEDRQFWPECRFTYWGELPVIDTQSFDLNSPELADIRHAVAKMGREKIMWRWFNLKSVPWEIMTEVNKLHDEWLGSKKLTSLTFSTNFFPLPVDENVYLLTGFSQEGKLLGAFSFLPYARSGAYSLDLMLKSDQSPNGLVEAAIAESISKLAGWGIQRLDLGMVALVGASWARPVREALKPVYNYKSLYFFKRKFNPVWKKMYLGYESQPQLPQVVLALARVHLRKRASTVS